MRRIAFAIRHQLGIGDADLTAKQQPTGVVMQSDNRVGKMQPILFDTVYLHDAATCRTQAT